MDPISIGLTAASTVMGAMGAVSEGKAARTAGRYEAAQMEQQAKAATARGTREAYEERRQGRILESNTRARMAAGGGLASDPGAIETLGKIKEITDYNSLAALYEAETQAEGLRHGARVREFEGEQAYKRGKRKAISTIISGASGMYQSGAFKKSPAVSTGSRKTEIDMPRRAGGGGRLKYGGG